MKQFRVCSLVLLAWSSFAAIAQPADVTAPSWRVGEQWSYDHMKGPGRQRQPQLELRISDVTSGRVTFVNAEAATQAVYEPDYSISTWDGEPYSEPIRILKFPLTAGSKWVHDNVREDRNCKRSVTKLETRVVGWDDIVVPAGTFKAVRIDSTGTWTNGCGSDRLAYRIWYSPAVKWYVKVESVVYAAGRVWESDVRELRAFKVEQP